MRWMILWLVALSLWDIVQSASIYKNHTRTKHNEDVTRSYKFDLRELAAKKGKVTGAFSLIASFPPAIQDLLKSDKKCDSRTLRDLPRLCFHSLTSASTVEEVLACSIISPPNDDSKFPFGMYSSVVEINRELKNIDTNSLTKIFSDCAMASMINDNCFTMTIDNNRFATSNYQYHDESSYTTTYSNYDSIGFSPSISIFGLVSLRSSFRASITSDTVTSTQEIHAATGSRAEQILGTLTNTCIDSPVVKKYIKQEYLDFWKQLRDYATTADARSVMNHDLFRRFTSEGLMIPASFVLGVSYQVENSFDYTKTDEKTSTAIEGSLSYSGGIDIWIAEANVGVTVAMKIQHTLDIQKIHSTVKTTIEQYGPCDFARELLYNRNLRECAQEVLGNWQQVTKPMRVAGGGFVNIATILDYSDLQMPVSVEKAMDEYYQSCSCFNPWYERDTAQKSQVDNGSAAGTNVRPGFDGGPRVEESYVPAPDEKYVPHRFTCLSGDGTKKYYGKFDSPCVSSLWYPYLNKQRYFAQDFHFI